MATSALFSTSRHGRQVAEVLDRAVDGGPERHAPGLARFPDLGAERNGRARSARPHLEVTRAGTGGRDGIGELPRTFLRPQGRRRQGADAEHRGHRTAPDLEVGPARILAPVKRSVDYAERGEVRGGLPLHQVRKGGVLRQDGEPPAGPRREAEAEEAARPHDEDPVHARREGHRHRAVAAPVHVAGEGRAVHEERRGAVERREEDRGRAVRRPLDLAVEPRAGRVLDGAVRLRLDHPPRLLAARPGDHIAGGGRRGLAVEEVAEERRVGVERPPPAAVGRVEGEPLRDGDGPGRPGSGRRVLGPRGPEGNHQPTPGRRTRDRGDVASAHPSEWPCRASVECTLASSGGEEG